MALPVLVGSSASDSFTAKCRAPVWICYPARVAVRFLHTADWQLGKQFGTLGEAGTRLCHQRLETVRKLAELATEQNVDAVLVAGDIFESQLASPATITGAVGAFQRFPGDWVILPGNHDCAEEGSVWERVRALTASPRVRFALTNEPILVAGGRMAVLPAPLTRRHEQRDLTASWDQCETPAGAFRVGLAHGCFEGEILEEAEATNPIAAGRVASAHLDYLALGDWHGTRKLSERAYYPGTPEPDRFRSNESGGVLVVEITSHGASPIVRRVPTGHYIWSAKDAHLQTANDIEQLHRELGSLHSPAQQVVRLRLEGGLALPDLVHLEERLDWWRGQFATLDLRRDQLLSRVDGSDFDAVQPPGFVADAIASLRASQAAGAASAQLALEILYQLCAAPENRP